MEYNREHFVTLHDEVIEIQQDQKKKTVTVTGMKVKMYDKKSGAWFWVIVGKDKEVITFGRDIVWINFPGLRKTEK